jgi:hypothetical protein
MHGATIKMKFFEFKMMIYVEKFNVTKSKKGKYVIALESYEA